MPASAYRRGGPGQAINYAMVGRPRRLLVAATSRGVCSVAMAGTDTELMRVLKDE